MLEPTRFAALCFALLCPPLFAEATDSRRAVTTARELLAAFNRHDSAAMATLVARDFELYYVGDDGTVSRALRGPAELDAEMTAYFAARPSVRSEIVGVVDGPVFVSFREQIVGGQSSLAVYEVRDGLIRRAWYFPAEAVSAVASGSGATSGEP